MLDRDLLVRLAVSAGADVAIAALSDRMGYIILGLALGLGGEEVGWVDLQDGAEAGQRVKLPVGLGFGKMATALGSTSGG